MRVAWEYSLAASPAATTHHQPEHNNNITFPPFLCHHSTIAFLQHIVQRLLSTSIPMAAFGSTTLPSDPGDELADPMDSTTTDEQESEGRAIKVKRAAPKRKAPLTVDLLLTKLPALRDQLAATALPTEPGTEVRAW
jgi:hypothetical protein